MFIFTDVFTDRECEVLKLLLNGFNNEEICKTLNIETTTVKAHLSSIYRKLDVKNRAQAIVKCVKIYFDGQFNFPNDLFE